ncbi:MAG: DUF177 domain-containing protein [Sandaracinaceae bacterium]|nr:DUF177 domain-containing protein [Sandaracinaceae bacterium]
MLDVHDLSDAGKSYDFPVRTEWLAVALEGTGVRVSDTAPEGRLAFHAHKQGADILIQGRVTSTLVTACSRCLEDAVVHVDADITRLLTARSAELRPEPDELELTPEDLDRDFYVGERVVLDDAVRENLLLEVPIQPLCRADCAGIPVPVHVRGPADLSAPAGGVDPRLAPLLSLVGKFPTEE